MYAMTIEKLVEDAKLRMGTPEQRQADIKERSKKFNRRYDREMKNLQITPELLNKVMTI